MHYVCRQGSSAVYLRPMHDYPAISVRSTRSGSWLGFRLTIPQLGRELNNIRFQSSSFQNPFHPVIQPSSEFHGSKLYSASASTQVACSEEWSVHNAALRRLSLEAGIPQNPRCRLPIADKSALVLDVLASRLTHEEADQVKIEIAVGDVTPMRPSIGYPCFRDLLILE